MRHGFFRLDDYCYYYNQYEYDTLMRSEPLVKSSFAVKAPGASASLTLILDAWDGDPGTRPFSYCCCPMVLQEHREGWFLFGFPTESMKYAIQYDADQQCYCLPSGSAYESLLRWANYYTVWKQKDLPPAHLELTTYDETGRILKTLRWDLGPAE